MALTYNTDQLAFRQSVSETMKRSAPVKALHDWRNNLEDDGRLRRNVAEALDLMRMTIPEAHGGGGFGFADIAAGIEQLGGGLQAGSTLPTLTVILALVFGVSGEQAFACSAFVASERAAIAFSGDGGVIAAEERTDGSFALSGTFPVIDGGTLASWLLCSAETAKGPGLFLLAANDRSVTRRPLQTLDLTRDAAEVKLVAAPALRLCRADGREVQMARAVAALAVSLEMLGAMDELFAMAVSYAKERFQFGRQIGSYQAIKHRLVGMLVETELARAVTAGGVERADASDSQLVPAASAAKAACAIAGPFLATEAIGVFGGIGYTWEHDAHLYFRRLNYLATIHGTASEHLDTVINDLTSGTGEHLHA